MFLAELSHCTVTVGRFIVDLSAGETLVMVELDGGGVQKLLGVDQAPHDGSSSGAKVGFVVVRTIQVYVIPGSIT